MNLLPCKLLFVVVTLSLTATETNEEAVSSGSPPNSSDAEKVDVWVSGLYGSDSINCGKSMETPCRTIAKGISNAPRYGVIRVDGRGTQKNPYNCSTLNQAKSVVIDKQLTIIGFWPFANQSSIHSNGSSAPLHRSIIHCNGTKWAINGHGSRQGSGMMIILKDFKFVDTALEFNESSVHIEGCSFINSTAKPAIRVDVINLKKISITIQDSHFARNNECLEVFINSTSAAVELPLVSFSNVSFSKNVFASSLLHFTIYGVLSNVFLKFYKITFQHNKANRGIHITALHTNGKVETIIDGATFTSNRWETAGLDVFANNTRILKAHVKSSTFSNEAGSYSDTGQGSCIRFKALNCQSSFFVTSSQFQHNVLEDSNVNQPRQRGCIHVEHDGNSITRFSNVVAFNGTSTALLLRIENKNNSLIIENSVFDNLRSFFGGAISVDVMMCHFRNGSEICVYNKAKNHALNASVLNSIFKNNAVDRNGGAISIVPEHAFQGQITIKNCLFENNFANDAGGHLYIGGGEASLYITHSRFKQSKHQLEDYEHKDILFFSNLGSFEVRSSVFDSNTTMMNIDPLLRISRAQSFSIDNQSSILCPYGSKLKILNSTYVKWGNAEDDPETDEMNNLYRISCEQCPWQEYSLQRGQTVGLEIKNFSCLPCLKGADCGRNIAALPGFWGYKVQEDPPLLNFARCPSGYCCEESENNHPIEFNTCCGYREGTLCGKCKNGYVESLTSQGCQPSPTDLDPSVFYVLLGLAGVVVLLLLIDSCCGYCSKNKDCGCACGRECSCCCRCSNECQCTKSSLLTYALMTIFFFQIIHHLITVSELMIIAKNYKVLIPDFFRYLYLLIVRTTNLEVSSQLFEAFVSDSPGSYNVLFKLSAAPLVFFFVLFTLLGLHFLVLVCYSGLCRKPEGNVTLIQKTAPKAMLLCMMPVLTWAFKALGPSYSTLPEQRFYYDGTLFFLSSKSILLFIVQVFALSFLALVAFIVCTTVYIRFGILGDEGHSCCRRLWLTFKFVLSKDIEAIRFYPKVFFASITAFIGSPLLKNILYTGSCFIFFEQHWFAQPYPNKRTNRVMTAAWILFLLLSFCGISCSNTYQSNDDSEQVSHILVGTRKAIIIVIVWATTLSPLAACVYFIYYLAKCCRA